MKQRTPSLLLQAWITSLVCCNLRLQQNRTGFEADTGLPIPGNLPAVLLPVLFAVSAVVLLTVAVRTLPTKAEGSFHQQFDLSRTSTLFAVMIGGGVMAFSGLWELIDALSGQRGYVLSADGMELIAQGSGTEQTAVIMGALSVAAGVCLLCGAVFSRRAESVLYLPLLAVPVCLLARMIFVYRLHSVDPVLEAHYLEILGLTVLILAFYRLSGFAVQAGNPRLFYVYAVLSVVLALPLMADGGTAAVLNLGGAIALTGFLRMQRPTDEQTSSASE